MTLSHLFSEPCADSLAFFDSKLFQTVQMNALFSDSKTFADAIPKSDYAHIVDCYEKALQTDTVLDLSAFVHQHFILPKQDELATESLASNIHEYIESLWLRLERPADKQRHGSLLPLNDRYIVPGGRFREIYYWDTYFTSLGLMVSGKQDVVESMLNNFLSLQQRYQCIPNGNRSYYLSRSQPPILALMVELLLPAKQYDSTFLSTCVSGLEREYRFWMKGKDLLVGECTEHDRVVKMPDGSFLNRYWDNNVTPRPESYREDVELMEETNTAEPHNFYRNIRAACESGWDFSSRWLGQDGTLASIRTTRILPVDLNCLLYKLESLLSHFYDLMQKSEQSAMFKTLAQTRKNAINRYMWSEEHQYFMDHDLDENHHSNVMSIAGVLPLFVQAATQEQAQRVSEVIARDFLHSGGLITTCNNSQQQWDSPNGWAPLHWFAIEGLTHYQFDTLAGVIKERWLSTNEMYFEQTGKMMEKYNVCQQRDKAGGGEYDVQEGFGWTNGVYQALKGAQV